MKPKVCSSLMRMEEEEEEEEEEERRLIEDLESVKEEGNPSHLSAASERIVDK